MAAQTAETIAVVEGIVCYHNAPESSSNRPVGKERVRIAIQESHRSINNFRTYLANFCGIKEECVKRGIGEHFDVRICRLVKDETNQPKAFSINTQEQWDLELPSLKDITNNASILQGIQSRSKHSIIIISIKESTQDCFSKTYYSFKLQNSWLH